MKKFRNLFILILLLVTVLFVGCTTECKSHVDSNKDGKCDNCGEKVEVKCSNHVDNNNDKKCDICNASVGNKEEEKEDEVKYNFMGEKFIIEVDIAASTDPFSDKYTGLFKSEKQALQEAVEKKYNIDVEYRTYPSSASWGGARERYISENNIAGTPTAHVYQIPSYSIGTLAVQNAISPLSTYIEKYGNKAIWKDVLEFGTVMGEQYGYSDRYSVATEGIFYNTGLLAKYLGEENAIKPTKLWLEGKWTWEAFKDLCKELDTLVAEDEYVLGGRAYNWAYQMLGANGVSVVDNNLKVGLDSNEAIDTFVYMNELFNSVAWDYESAALSNATSIHMIEGKVAFHNGQPYWIDNKWTDGDHEPIEFGFVPYPYGPNASNTDGSLNEDKYYINDVYGETQYVISAAYSKDLIDPAYHNMVFHDEVIFKIWSELQYFPEVDPTTGEASIDEYLSEYADSTINFLYAHEESIEAHLSIATKCRPDYFYSLDEAKGHTADSYMLTVQQAVLGNVDNIRSEMESLARKIEASFKAKYNLADDYYG